MKAIKTGFCTSLSASQLGVDERRGAERARSGCISRTRQAMMRQCRRPISVSGGSRLVAGTSASYWKAALRRCCLQN